jgi:hypothetical protein
MLAALALALLARQLPTQGPKPPGILAEQKEPFCWYLVPSDVIGFKDCPQGFQVTFDGAFYNSFGELDFSAGATPTPVNQRVKTLYKGHYPILEYGFDRDGASYQVESFGATPTLDPREDLVALIRVTIDNPGRKDVHATFKAAFGPKGPFGRAPMGMRKWYPAKFMDEAAFKAAKDGEVKDGAATRGGHLVFTYDGTPTSTDAANLAVEYDYDLKPHERRTIDLKIPFAPIKLALADPIKAMKYDDSLAAITKFWDGIYAKAMSVELNDPKVTDAMLASLNYDLISRDIDEDGTHYTQTVNKFQYHYFYARDTSFIAHSYDLLNLPDIARQVVEHYLVRDASGKVIKFLRQSPDDWGQSLWAVGAHFRATGDVAFAKDVAPAIAPHLDEFEAEVKKDPLGLWPVAGPYDNELINGHYTSHNLWALLGLREAENLSRAAGDTATADRAHKLYDAFFANFNDKLTALTAKDQGYIPPGMDSPEAGNDWENASGGVYPFGVFAPDNPWVSATIAMEREFKYREGIMTWGPNAWAGKVAMMAGRDFDPGFLHDYDTFQVDETLLAREEQQKVVEDLYSTLVHTSATHAGFETSIKPWGNRDPDDNLPPHGWFAARYNELVRNMLVREDGDTLHIASALAPQWIEPGKRIKVERAATSFGPLDFTIESRVDGATLTLKPTWRTAPAQLRFHIPWFVSATSAQADGKKLTITNNAVDFPAGTKKLELVWAWTDHPDLSYARAVELWLHKAYAPKLHEDMDHLFPTPTHPMLDSDTMFIGQGHVRIASRTGKGLISYTLDSGDGPSTEALYGRPFNIDKTTTLTAVEHWQDGRVSEPLIVKIVKADPVDAVSAQVQPGLNFQYYEGAFKSMPDFDALTPVRSGVTVAAELGAIQHRPEVFAIRMTGYIKVPTDGIYKFTIGSDDGSKLWIGDTLLADDDGPHAYTEVTGPIALKAGLHPIRIHYYDAGDANFLHLFWQGPDFDRRPVESGALFH